MKRILIVEDELVVAENIAAILENEGFFITGIVDNADEALELINTDNLNLVICDVFIKGNKTGIELVKEFSKRISIPFLYITAFSDQRTIQQAGATRPSSFLVKPFTERQLIAAVYMALMEQDAVINGSVTPPTKREVEILERVAKGQSSKQIAMALFLSEYTVRTHRRNLMNKYNVLSSSELIALAAKNKWISLK